MNGNPLIGIKEAIWVFVVVFGLSWFGPSSSVEAVSPPPQGGYPYGQFSASHQRVGGREIAGFNARQTRTAQAENLTPSTGLKPIKQKTWAGYGAAAWRSGRNRHRRIDSDQYPEAFGNRFVDGRR